MGGNQSSSFPAWQSNNFMGMKFQCTVPEMQQQIMEEYTLIFYLSYLWVWLEVQFWYSFGILYTPFKAFGDSYIYDWQSKMQVIQANALNNSSLYKILKIFNI